MSTTAISPATSRPLRWAGLIVGALCALFLLMDAVMHILAPPFVLQANAQLGYPAHLTTPLGIVELLCLALYVFPRTAVLGAILLTGYLGGATASKVRLEDPSWLFSVAIGILVWAGLYLRDRRIRELIPLQ